MSWCVVLTTLLVQSVRATFPPVDNPPPIPNQGVRTVDISGQRFYVQDDLQINPPQAGIAKDEVYLPPLPTDPKVDDQRWFVYENQSGETSDFPSSTETFDRYYSNGLPAVGPVATPVPDDNYVAQPSGTSKVIPDGPANIGPNIWVLTKGPDDQYIPQRMVQVQMPQERISADFSPQVVPGPVRTLVPQPQVKTSGLPVIPANAQQQVWVRVASPVQPPTVDIQQPIKQYVQTDIVQDPQVAVPFQSSPNVVSAKSSTFVLPPPPPPPFKGGSITQSQQTVPVGQPVLYKGGDIISPSQTVLVNQPANYKGVDITTSNQAVLVNQPANYKGVDTSPSNQAVLVNQPENYKGLDITPNQAVLVNQPANYKGVDIAQSNQAVVVNTPVNYKGVDLTPTNQAVIVNSPVNYKGVDITSPNKGVPLNQPATYKGIDLIPSNQAVLLNQQTNYKGGDFTSPKQAAVFAQPQISGPVTRTNVLAQVKHIWIPTSQRTGKFITVPVGTVVDSGKSVPSKGIPLNAAAPISVSGTWVLKQDGSFPRFESQGTIPIQVVQKGTPLAQGSVLQFTSAINQPILGKSVDAKVPVDIWANSKDFSNPTFAANSFPLPAPFPIPSGKAGSVTIGKSGPVLNAGPQKSYISSGKSAPLSPPVPVASPVLQVTKGKPCLIGPQKYPVAPKPLPYPVYRSAITVNRQSIPRILRLNRYPYGSYYVLNPRVASSLYAYPRPQAPVMQQTKNNLVRIVSAKQLGLPQRQMYIAVPRKQVALPAPQIVSPLLQTRYTFPSVQAINRIRYAYPRGSYLRTLPTAGKNVFIFPSGKKTKPETLQSSSSESSSSESSSSESRSKEAKPKSKEEIGEAKSEPGSESPESKSERETEDVEAAASAPEPESKEASEELSAETDATSVSKDSTESETNSAS